MFKLQLPFVLVDNLLHLFPDIRHLLLSPVVPSVKQRSVLRYYFLCPVLRIYGLRFAF